MLPRRAFHGFLCYAHEDRRLVGQQRETLDTRLNILRAFEVSIWSDVRILVGERWGDAIRAALAAADFGLVMLSPALLDSRFIREVELPALLGGGGPVVMPVGLERVDFVRSELRGIDEHQVFLYRGRWFADQGGQNRVRFCDELAGQIADRLATLCP